MKVWLPEEAAIELKRRSSTGDRERGHVCDKKCGRLSSIPNNASRAAPVLSERWLRGRPATRPQVPRSTWRRHSRATVLKGQGSALPRLGAGQCPFSARSVPVQCPYSARTVPVWIFPMFGARDPSSTRRFLLNPNNLLVARVRRTEYWKNKRAPYGH